MNLEKYDKIIWRFNGALILFASLGAILVCSIVGYKLVKEVFEHRPVHDIVNINQQTKKEEYLRLGYFNPLKGTDLIFAPLTTEQNYDATYFSKSTSSARNYLIFNTKNKESYWIWRDNSFLVMQDTSIFNQITDEKNQKTKGLVFEYVASDSNSDSILDSKDLKSVQYFDLLSKKIVPVAEGVDRVIGTQQASGEEVLFFYSKVNKSYFKSLSLSSLSLSDEKEVGTSP